MAEGQQTQVSHKFGQPTRALCAVPAVSGAGRGGAAGGEASNSTRFLVGSYAVQEEKNRMYVVDFVDDEIQFETWRRNE